MNKHNVPKLNLAPKLERPLSLWNPLDYLRLLYWMFFYPQAIQWYVDRFSGESVPTNNYQLKEQIAEWQKIRQNPIQFQLVIQTLVIATSIFIAITLYKLLNYTSIPIYLSWTKEFDVFLGFFLAVWTGLINATSSGVAEGVLISVPFGIFMGIIYSLSAITENIPTVVAAGLSFGLLLSATTSRSDIIPSQIIYIVPATFFGFFFFVMDVIFSTREIEILNILTNCLIFGLTAQIAILRPESWLFSFPFNFSIRDQTWFSSHTTSIPLPFLSTRLKNWLRQDWDHGLNNISQLLHYTLQFIPAVEAVNQVLAEISSEQVIDHVSSLTKVYDGWRLIYFVSASLQYELLLSILPFRSQLSKKLNRQDFLIATPRLDTPARATAAGFWYLHEKQPAKATKAFAKVRSEAMPLGLSLLYGEEVYTLANTLAIFKPVTELNQIASLDVPAFPQDNLLRPVTWETLNNLRRVVEEVKTIKNSVSHTTKALALNRAIGELTTILDAPEIIPEAERELIIEIAQNWKQALERITKDIGNITVTKPVANPYIIGDPVQGSLFAGREDIMRQLEELWLDTKRLQSIVLYGHRRMGKTSILLNVTNYSGSKIQVAYVNLQRLGTVSLGLGEVLIAITDEIAAVLQIPPPDDEAILKLPQRTFERYLKSVIASMDCQGLIIALDEFETIEELIRLGQIPPGFMGFLRGLMQMSPKIAFIFAGLHTLEEMTADYFQPFFASVIPLHVGFLNVAATRQILANPALGDDFFLDYTRETFDRIQSLTAGQPYLVQLIGFQLVRRYNQQIFEGESPNQTFTTADVIAVINPEFYQKGRYYFEGVWRQAAQGVKGQQEIIKALAPYPQGLSQAEIVTYTQLDRDVCCEAMPLCEAVSRRGTSGGNLRVSASFRAASDAIAILSRHDVIIQTDTGWQIIVELFRQWVLDQFFEQ